MTTPPTPIGIDAGRLLLGTIFPNADIGTDPEAIRDYARAVEDAGFDYLLIGGGGSDAVLRRVARLADGWMPLLQPTEDAASAVARLRKFLREAGRDATSFGVDARIRATGSPDDWIVAARRWRDLGATHLCLNSITRGTPVRHQLETSIRMKRAIADSRTV